jgi:hypothetical protein
MDVAKCNACRAENSPAKFENLYFIKENTKRGIFMQG